MNNETNDPKQFCTGCHVGSMQPWRATYARWHGGHFIVMPGVPAWRCDFCGDTFYDNGALVRLALLLGPESNLEGRKRWPTRGLEDNQDASVGERRRL